MSDNLGQGHVLAEGHDPKSCATCRREAQIAAMTQFRPSGMWDEDGTHELMQMPTTEEARDQLLAYFRDNGESALASAIEFGITPHSEASGVYRINYPTQEEQ